MHCCLHTSGTGSCLFHISNSMPCGFWLAMCNLRSQSLAACAGGGETGEELDISLLRITLYHEYWQGLLHELDLETLRTNSAVAAAPDASKRALPSSKADSSSSPVASSSSSLALDSAAPSSTDTSVPAASPLSADAAAPAATPPSSPATSQGEKHQEPALSTNRVEQASSSGM